MANDDNDIMMRLKLVAIHIRSTDDNGIHTYFRFTPETAPLGMKALIASLERVGRKVVVFSEYRPLDDQS